MGIGGAGRLPRLLGATAGEAGAGRRHLAWHVPAQLVCGGFDGTANVALRDTMPVRCGRLDRFSAGLEKGANKAPYVCDLSSCRDHISLGGRLSIVDCDKVLGDGHVAPCLEAPVAAEPDVRISELHPKEL